MTIFVPAEARSGPARHYFNRYIPYYIYKMLLTLLIFLPALICLFWIIIHGLLAPRADSFKSVVALLAVAGLYIFTDSCYSDMRSSYRLLSIAAVAAQFAAPAIIPVLMVYIRNITKKNRRTLFYEYVWVLVPVILLTGATVLYAVCGPDNVMHFIKDLYTNGDWIVENYNGTLLYPFYIWIVILFRVVIGIEAIILVIYISTIALESKPSLNNYINHLRRGDSIKFTELQLINILICLLLLLPKMLLSRTVLQEVPWLPAVMNAILTGALSQFAYTALFSEKEWISRAEMKNAFLYNYNSANKREVIGEMLGEILDNADTETLETVREHILMEETERKEPEESIEEFVPEEVHKVVENIMHTSAASWDENSLMSRFQKIMVEEQLFLQPKLTLADVAERLNTNKTYISKLVNNTYNLGFPELINTLRVDYAEAYIMNNRDAKQDKIAEDCGFLSASSFNIIFKKTTGMTPKVWIATVDRESSKRGTK